MGKKIIFKRVESSFGDLTDFRTLSSISFRTFFFLLQNLEIRIVFPTFLLKASTA